jgi:hypothetical protein
VIDTSSAVPQALLNELADTKTALSDALLRAERAEWLLGTLKAELDEIRGGQEEKIVRSRFVQTSLEVKESGTEMDTVEEDSKTMVEDIADFKMEKESVGYKKMMVQEDIEDDKLVLRYKTLLETVHDLMSKAKSFNEKKRTVLVTK